MHRYQFPISNIIIQPKAKATGPFAFNLGPQLPAGINISSIKVASLLNGVDTTDKLIATTELSANTVNVYFNYPGADLHGDHQLTFIYTLANGAVDEADFTRVWVTSV